MAEASRLTLEDRVWIIRVARPRRASAGWYQPHFEDLISLGFGRIQIAEAFGTSQRFVDGVLDTEFDPVTHEAIGVKGCCRGA